MQTALGLGSIIQTFEVGEDTSDWGDDWVAPVGYTQSAPTFLDEALGGQQAGMGTTAVGQEAYRIFKNNTAGLDLVSASYRMSLYVQIDFGADPPSSGNFAIANGDYGAFAGQLRLNGDGSNGDIPWMASDGTSFVDTGINLTFSTPYFTEFIFDPVAQTYDVTVSRVNVAGVVQETGSASGLGYYPNAQTNGQYGKLLFHAAGSAGDVDFSVDNISVTNSIPEPATTALIIVLASGLWIASRHRKR